MKLLKKIRLINWHRFENETIELSKSTLLSGENGAGKSTILDAIQYCITCSKANFNKAAHEKGKRNLNSYIRCKTGREDRPYERTGELTAHISLEFFDEAKNAPFIIGVVMDTASEEKEPNSAWYLMEKRTLSDDLFFYKNTIKSISRFRSTNRGIKSWCVTQTEAKRMILSRFGRLEDKFFSLIPKALAFRPIHDIKDFVYSYVLDEKEVNIDALRENVRSYQELERMLEDVKKRISELENISAKEKEAEMYDHREQVGEYFIAHAEFDLTDRSMASDTEKIRENELRGRSLVQSLAATDEERDTKEEMIRSLQVELDGDEDYRALGEAQKKKSALEAQLKEDAAAVSALSRSCNKAVREAETLLALEKRAADETQGHGGRKHASDDAEQLLSQYAELLSKIKECEDLTDAALCLDKVIAYKAKRFREVEASIAEMNYEIRQKADELAEVNGRIKTLSARKLVYRTEVLDLKRRIEKQLQDAGHGGEVRILCEMLEITDPKWQNAVEGYLNTQRFYLIVEPDDFDLAISVYDQMRSKKKIYGVGLVNTARLEDYDEAPEGSLAACVTSKNIWARRYVNMVLGKVHCCNSYQELKKYPVSITRQCMRYQNHVVSAINPAIFRTPYIGGEAYKIQLAQAEEQRDALEKEKKELEGIRKFWEKFENPLSSDEDHDIRRGLPAIGTKRTHEEAYAKIKEEVKRLKASQTLIEKQIRLEELKKEKRALDDQHDQVNREIGQCHGTVESLKGHLEELRNEKETRRARLKELGDAFGNELDQTEEDYRKAVSGMDLEKFRVNRISARKGVETLRTKAVNEMSELMRQYQSAHNFGAAATREGYPEYEAEYEKLKNSQLLEYEEKVYRARNAAEEEFREQFLSKLQENIKQAQQEFRELNQALSEIHFSHEKYVFRYEPRRDLKKYYDMIMDDFNVMGGESIFSGTFNANHKEVIEELFEKLAVDDEDSAKTLQFYTDYRTYMDYDIKIELDDGSYMLYSKVSREKSGGETQTPFYITVAASFMQMYKASIGGDAVGLIMMDEAFNNMDDERIAGVLDFMTHTNLQTIIAAPPDKIQYIGPSMDRVLLVLTDQHVSYVEDFTKEAR